MKLGAMKILIVEDDVMLADILEATLLNQGHDVCGMAMDVAESVALVRLHRPDVAVVDMRLKDPELGSDIARQLAEAGDLNDLGILYVTGGGVDFLHQHASIGHAYLPKPYSPTALAAALPIVRSIARGCAISGALPYGMQLLGFPQRDRHDAL
jgi:DNA-binding response OmpR family regulator